MRIIYTVIAYMLTNPETNKYTFIVIMLVLSLTHELSVKPKYKSDMIMGDAIVKIISLYDG
jgi:hypothetical protein